MGLDMYLNRKTYVETWSHMSKEQRHSITVKLNNKKHPYIDPKKVTYITERAAYWRKANAIHKWFVDNVQGGEDECVPHYVEISQLQTLNDLCVDIKEFYDKNGDKGLQEFADERLPTQSGFFFGNTDYLDDGDNNYYMDDINSTIEQLKPLLDLNKEIEEKREKGDRVIDWPEYEYRSSW